jgi:hypothetical protein
VNNPLGQAAERTYAARFMGALLGERFELISQIGSGGFGTVYQVLQILAECLAATGQRAEAELVLREAYDELSQRAARTGDAALRKGYLENVPHNARVMQLANEWLGL